MNIKMGLNVLMFFLASFSVLAAPVEYSGNGDYYEVVSFSDNGITPDWKTAETLAKGMAYDGVQGTLASVTNPGLDAFLWNLVVESSNPTESMGGIFLGGYKTSSGWEWENGQAVSYFNYAPGEANNLFGIENYLMYWWSPAGLNPPNPGWNDTNETSSYCINADGSQTPPPCNADSTLTYLTWGYMVEFDPVPAPSTLWLLTVGLLFQAKKLKSS